MIGDHRRLVTSAKITHLSIRMSFVGSIELFRDATLDDPRLDPRLDPVPILVASPPMGVMLNVKDMVDKSTEIDGEGWAVDWGRCGRRGKRGGGSLSVRSAIATYNVDYIRPSGTSSRRCLVRHWREATKPRRFYLFGPDGSDVRAGSLCRHSPRCFQVKRRSLPPHTSWRVWSRDRMGEGHPRVLPGHSSQESGQMSPSIRAVETGVLEA